LRKKIPDVLVAMILNSVYSCAL